jgi:hypothetical protein
MPNVDIWKIHVLLTYTISELSFNFFGGDFWWILKFSIFVHLCMYVCLWCLVFPRHSVQATEHSRPCFLQLQRFESQFVLHLQYIVFRSSSGAGGKLDLIGTHMLCSIDHLQSFASILSASPIHCILWIDGCILSLITASTILLITSRTVIPR